MARNKRVREFEVVDFGIKHLQLFQGLGICGTQFDNAVCGIGDDAREALDDCLEQIADYENGADIDDLERRILAEYPGFADKDALAEDSVSKLLADWHKAECHNAEDWQDCDDCQKSELYYHIGIRWTM